MSENLDLCSKNIHYYQRFWTSSARCWHLIQACLKFESMSETLHTCQKCWIYVWEFRFVKNEIQDNPFGSVLQEVGILSGIFDRSPKNFGAAFVWRKIFWSSVSKFIKVLRRRWKEYFKFSFCFLFFWQPWLICLTLLAPESATVITGNSDL